MAKLRLMCSYGGHVVPRPGNKSLCYAGGDTRIISINREAVTSVTSLISDLSTRLSLQYPFTLKYQLPGLDLDSLISITSEDDFRNFIDEYDRLSLSSTPARVRLFIFPLSSEYRLGSSSQHYPQSVIDHPKTDTWFSDALNSAKILHSEGGRSLMGMEGEGQGHSFSRYGGGNLTAGSIGPESAVLETSSSFGSTSSAASLSGLPAIKPQVEDSDFLFQDISKFKVSSSDSVPSGNTIRWANAYQESLPYQEPVVYVSSGELKFISEPVQVENLPTDVSFGMQANEAFVNVENFSFIPSNHMQHQQVPLVHANGQYMQQNYTAGFPITSHNHLHQPGKPIQQFTYPSTNPQLVYYAPVEQMRAYNLPVFSGSGLVDNGGFVNPQLMQPKTSFVAPFVPQRIDQEEPKVPLVPLSPLQNYSSGVAMESFVNNVPCQQNAAAGAGHLHHHPQVERGALRESPRYGSELDDDLSRVQIYKSQPPPPSPPSRYESMTKATTVLLSEAFAHLQMQNNLSS